MPGESVEHVADAVLGVAAMRCDVDALYPGIEEVRRGLKRVRLGSLDARIDQVDAIQRPEQGAKADGAHPFDAVIDCPYQSAGVPTWNQT